MAEFLFEIGLEEIPARMIASAEQELAARVKTMLTTERLVGEEAQVRSYATPRRLAVAVSGVLGQQEDVTDQVTGPAWKVAFKDDQPDAGGTCLCPQGGGPSRGSGQADDSKGRIRLGYGDKGRSERGGDPGREAAR